MSLRLQPLLYRVIVFAGDTDVPQHRMPPLWPNELAPVRTAPLHVRHLALYSISAFTEIKNLLAVCTGVRNLAFYFATDPSFIPYLERIRPLLLCVDGGDLFAGTPDFSHPMFANVTHLDLADTEFPAYNEDSWQSLALLPCMTHISFNFYTEKKVPVRFLRMLLSDSKLLQALIIIWANDQVYEVGDDAGAKYPTHDVRFVMTVCDDFLDDWIGGAWGRADLWDRADEFIRLKRRGDISSESHSCSIRLPSCDWHITEDVYFLTTGE
jgi:hypothetical protein